MAHTTQLDHTPRSRKFADAVSRIVRPKGSAAKSQAPAPRARQDADGYDQVDRRLMDTFPASDAVSRY